ncbi:DNA polymerase III subunit [Zongyangia hominis]|uniref:DNA polymerase III subunit n=1 Tax=Zongyangia hominis TaxID=2763677 RepID=A0A926EB78_9FIRM|nr:DNA polymerase III subunit [Zongyangia hominis]MBC8571325.1 DNA polymerase III subunit [Zongyangia hominis]
MQTLAGLCADGRLSHAILLEGEGGLGKRRLARIIAAMALCKERPGGCMACDSCKNVLADNHPDVEIYGGEGGASSFHIEDIRRLRQHAGVLPNQADKKVFILQNCENMTTAAQNALLKVLEEPPSYCMFILTAKNRNALLSTILSRVICFQVSELSRREFMDALAKLLGPEAAADGDKLYEVSGGNLGLALRMAGEEKVQRQMEAAGQLLDAIKGADEFAMLSICAKFERDKEGLMAVLGYLRRKITTAMEGRLRGEASEATLRGISTGDVLGITDLIDATLQSLERNQNLGLTSTLFCASLNNICNG